MNYSDIKTDATTSTKDIALHNIFVPNKHDLL